MGYTFNISIFKHIKEGLIFGFLFGLNIAGKEIYRFFDREGIVVSGTLFLSIVILFVFVKMKRYYVFAYLTIFILYLFLIFSSLMLPYDPAYGFHKAFLGLIIPLVVFQLFQFRNWMESDLLNYLVFTVFSISIYGLMAKMNSGFFDRSINFGLLGPITFGWINGMAFLAIALRGKKNFWNYILLSFFFLMIVWTGSKGPLIAILIIVLLFFRRVLGDKLMIRLASLLLIMGSYILLSTYGDDIRSVKAIKSYIEDPRGYVMGAGKGSVGIREYYFKRSIDLFQENTLFGVGFGNWNLEMSNVHSYPHNIFLEVISETGILGLCLFVVLLFQLKYKTCFGVIGLFSLITLSVSGDVSYFRYALLPFLISTYLIYNKK